MAKITTRAQLVLGTELLIDETARTIGMAVAGNLIAKDGAIMQAIWSKCVELWNQATFQDSPFPLYAIDARSGQFQIGYDGIKYNNWRWLDDATRSYIRDSGWDEFTPVSPGADGRSNTGTLARQYVGAVGLASGFPAGAQFYYQRASGGAAANFTYTDAPNEAIQVFGDAANGNFDNRAFFRMFCREYGYTYDAKDLSFIGETGTGAFKIALPINVSTDSKITANDAAMSGAPYSGITVEYFATNQNRTIGGTSYPFRKIIDGNGATLEQIYTKIQYLLRQNSDIDSGSGTVIGKTADQLCAFQGDTLYTTTGVYIDNLLPEDENRIVFTDQNGIQRTNPWESTGYINFNSVLVGAGSSFRMFYKTLPGTGNDWGEAGAVTVNDASGSPIAGSIGSAAVPFTYDYDNNNQGGRTPGTDAAIVLVASRPGSSKHTVAEATITRSKTLGFAVTGEQDRAYI